MQCGQWSQCVCSGPFSAEASADTDTEDLDRRRSQAHLLLGLGVTGDHADRQERSASRPVTRASSPPCSSRRVGGWQREPAAGL
jgi:hypothetical protein